jgi:hypothetical protein
MEVMAEEAVLAEAVLAEAEAEAPVKASRFYILHLLLAIAKQ